MPDLDTDIQRYIITHQLEVGDKLPTINELSAELGVSVSKIREELAVARALGWVQIKPRTGTQVQAFDFGPAATVSVLYALGLDRGYFQDFSRLRRSVELSFWHEAVAKLTSDEIAKLRQFVACAREKLNRIPIEVPFNEHRALHLMFFVHLDNPFVQGILQAYWDAYQAFGLAIYADISYHREVWDYHEHMVECVARGDFDGGHRALQEHMNLLRYSPEQDQPSPKEIKERSAPITHFFE
ncbi:MAG: FadR family transcriptional regulator [Anaerolineae bacterium]|nr:FadR family transcriptional regulator [Anaerolineae bacterium]